MSYLWFNAIGLTRLSREDGRNKELNGYKDGDYSAVQPGREHTLGRSRSPRAGGGGAIMPIANAQRPRKLDQGGRSKGGCNFFLLNESG